MVETATRLFQSQGYAATGMKQLVEEAKAPRGSLYFHFPGGKEELAAEAVAQHAHTFGAQLGAVLDAAPTALDAARAAIGFLASDFEARGCSVGCPVTAIALEQAGHSLALQQATREAYETWIAMIVGRLVREGFSVDSARSRARALIAALEGALIMARAYDDRGPLDDVAAALPGLLTP